MGTTPFARLANLGEELGRTSKRLELVALLSDFLQELAPDEVSAAARLVIGQVFPGWDERALNVSWKSVMEVVDGLTDASPAVREELGARSVDGGQFVRLLLENARRRPSQPPPLRLLEVYEALEQIAAAEGKGVRTRREALLRALLERATPLEAEYLTKIIYQEMRHGVNEGLLLEGIARASGSSLRWVQRAYQVWGDLGEVARVTLSEGESGLQRAGVHLFRAVRPMLAETADDLDEAFVRYQGQVALEYKLDGARVQIHRQGRQVRVYSRHLADVTTSLPDAAAEVQAGIAAEEAIFDGEAIAVDAHGRPLPFQYLMRRFRRKHAVATTLHEVPVRLYLFDLLYLDGQSWVDVPYRERWHALAQAAGSLNLVPRLIPTTLEEGRAFAEAAYREGHEGVMIKDLNSLYTPGVRGKSWLKLKHTFSLDLVIVAADWGYGRRHGWLSNYHLAARDAESGQYRVVGKTFKGLTDAEFQAMTERLLALERGRRGSTVFVQPQVVVEVTLNEIQESRQYEAGLALRFARIARVREDKSPVEADSLQTLRRLYEQQFKYKGQPT
ncbi:MAG: ATP-dependent DNA ligase [Anaerolineae bacterium]